MNICCFNNSYIEYLYVIIPYFNFCNYKKRKSLFLDFIQHIQNYNNIRIIVAELKENNKSFDLPNLNRYCNVYKHFRFTTKDCIWLKENLINLAILRLTDNWKYIAWIDADIIFMNKLWVNNTISALKTHNIVQLFQTAVNLGPSGEAMQIDNSFAYMYNCSNTKSSDKYKYTYWHPGFAWACTKEAYYQLGGLIDFAILGASDYHMAMSIIGNVEKSYPTEINIEYKKLLKIYETKAKNMKLGFIKGTILHRWHGSLENRKYTQRWDILTKNNYVPSEDIFVDDNGLIQLTDKGGRLKQLIYLYFEERNEDD